MTKRSANTPLGKGWERNFKTRTSICLHLYLESSESSDVYRTCASNDSEKKQVSPDLCFKVVLLASNISPQFTQAIIQAPSLVTSTHARDIFWTRVLPDLFFKVAYSDHCYAIYANDYTSSLAYSPRFTSEYTSSLTRDIRIQLFLCGTHTIYGRVCITTCLW